MHENPFAFMLEELDDEVDCLLNRLHEIDRNLDREIDKLNGMIGETGPRNSTKFQDIATQLKSNLQDKVNQTMMSRRSSFASSNRTSTNYDRTSVNYGSLDTESMAFGKQNLTDPFDTHL